MKIKRNITIMLILLLILALSFNSVLATSNQNFSTTIIEFENDYKVYSQVLSDTPNMSIVKTWDDSTESIVTYNKKTKLISTQTTNKTTYQTTESSYVIGNNKKQIDISNSFTPQSVIISSNSDFTGGYSYTITSYSSSTVWDIKIPDSPLKSRTQTSNNRSDLDSFRSSVNSLKLNQAILSAELGTGLFTTAITLIMTPEPWTTVVGALIAMGFALGAFPLALNVWQSSQDARYYYAQVL